MAALFLKVVGVKMRKLVWFTIGFSAACLLSALVYGQWILLGAVIMLLLTGMLAFFCKKTGRGKQLLLILLGTAIGLCWFGLYDSIFVLVPRVADSKILPITIQASDYSYETDYGSAFEGEVKLNDKTYWVKAYINEKKTFKPGDSATGRFRFRLTTAGGKYEPTNHRTEGIFLLAYQVGDLEFHETEDVPWQYLPAVWRQKLLERIGDIFSEDSGAFAAALLLGDRTGIDYELDSAFKVSGISHIIAVSGLHVSILFGLVYTLTSKRRILSCIVGIPSLILFAAIVGFTPSITRACLMQSLMLIAMMLDKEYDPPTALAFAVLTMLVWNPISILSVSLQLSVGCMAGIFLFSEKIRSWMAGPNFLNVGKGKGILTKLKNAVATSVSVSLSATVVTTPLVAYYFGCVSLIGVLTNLITLWVISFIFYGIILCLIVSLISMGLAGIFGWVVSIPIAFVLETAKILSKLPMAAVYTISPYVVVWLIGVYVMLAIFLFEKKKKPKLLIASVLLTLFLSQFFAWAEPRQDALRVTVLDVGQGQSVLLQSEGKTFLVDCGGDYAEDAADIAAETLLSQGVSRLDGLIVTHFDKDHVGGVEYLLKRICTDKLILPDVDDEEGIGAALSHITDGEVQYVKEDLLYAFGDAQITVIAPFSRESSNENSICVLFQRENCDILITGDRAELGETILLQKHELPELELLIAGHHGSAYSTGEKLLSATTPETVIISVGEGNRYGHPSEKLLSRLEKYGCKVYRTDQSGTIIFRG